MIKQQDTWSRWNIPESFRTFAIPKTVTETTKSCILKMEKHSSAANTGIGKRMSGTRIWQAFFGEKTPENTSEKKNFPNSVFRSSAKAGSVKTTRKRKAQYSPMAYMAACATNLALAGFTGEYLSRNLPEGHVSFSGLFVALAFVLLATFFGFRGWVKTYMTSPLRNTKKVGR